MERLEFLDSFRGVLCISVLLSHYDIGSETLSGFFLGVIGFFILSSFLLTHRLIKQYENAKNIHQIINITINYFIMRFFRIYVPYMIFCILNVELIKEKDVIKDYTIYHFISLKDFVQMIHIWTMPVEIKFYFIIPPLAYIFSNIYKKKLIVWIIYLMNFIYMIIVKRFNLFSVGDFYDVAEFEPYIPIFLMGSILAVLYIHLEHSKGLELLNQYRINNYIISLICIIIFVCLCRFQGWFNSDRNNGFICASFMSLLLLFMLIVPANYLNQFLSQIKTFYIFGKYSYGVYLFHINCRNESRKFQSIMISDQFILYIILSLVVGIIFFHIIENNSMKLAKLCMNQVNKYFSSYKEPIEITINK